MHTASQVNALNVTLWQFKCLISKPLIMRNPGKHNRMQIVLLSFYTVVSVLVWHYAF